MRNYRFYFLMLGFSILICSCCLAPEPDYKQEAEQATTEIQLETQCVLDLVMEAQITGDRTRLDQFLQEEDPTGEIRSIVNDYLASIESQSLAKYNGSFSLEHLRPRGNCRQAFTR